MNITDMNSAPKLMRSISSRSMKRVDKPKPIKNQMNQLSHSASESAFSISNSYEEIINALEMTSLCVANRDTNDCSTQTSNLLPKLKLYGPRLEETHKDHLDRAFNNFRSGAGDDTLDAVTRLNLLLLIELRAMKWQPCSQTNSYYGSRCSTNAADLVYEAEKETNQPQHTLSPGEIVKSSGKYSTPTKMPNKNYFKDEIVIRNSDSGKVMGIKGRRVHMIEELSETVISFQRVAQGAKERLVQITGPDEDKILFAKQLMEDTIKRNASPVRESELDNVSTSSINSSASEGDTIPLNSAGESSTYRFTVNHQDDVVYLKGYNYDLLKTCKIILELYLPKRNLDDVSFYPSLESDDKPTLKDSNLDTAVRKETQPKQPDPELPKVIPKQAKETAVSETHVRKENVKVMEYIPQKAVESPVKKENKVTDYIPQKAVETPVKKETFKVMENTPQKAREPKGNNFSPSIGTKTETKSKTRLEQYSRQLLLDLSSTRGSLMKPKDWEHIKTDFPTLVKKDYLDSEGISIKDDFQLAQA